jgi:hypothetical protein
MAKQALDRKSAGLLVVVQGDGHLAGAETPACTGLEHYAKDAGPQPFRSSGARDLATHRPIRRPRGPRF